MNWSAVELAALGIVVGDKLVAALDEQREGDLMTGPDAVDKFTVIRGSGRDRDGGRATGEVEQGKE